MVRVHLDPPLFLVGGFAVARSAPAPGRLAPSPTGGATPRPRKARHGVCVRRRRAGQQPGALAQLGEHLLCKQGVVGSIPTRSTIALSCGFADAGAAPPWPVWPRPRRLERHPRPRKARHGVCVRAADRRKARFDRQAAIRCLAVQSDEAVLKQPQGGRTPGTDIVKRHEKHQRCWPRVRGSAGVTPPATLSKSSTLTASGENQLRTSVRF